MQGSLNLYRVHYDNIIQQNNKKINHLRTALSFHFVLCLSQKGMVIIMKIVTLTLNPAFDIHCYSENFKPYHESIAQITSKEAGGKGVNISRALTSNGVENIAVVIVGKENGEEFCKSLRKDGVSVLPIWTEGRIRENITLHETENPETRISFNGFTCADHILAQVQKEIGIVDNNTIVTFTGSIPKGINSVSVLKLLKKLKDQGAKTVIDSRSISLYELTEFKPWLIKPNKDEAMYYTGKTLETVEEVASFAEELHEQGVENALISLGGDGAVLACAQGIFYAKTAKINVRSTIGAGDSTLAGFIDATSKAFCIESTLKRAMAYGMSACMQDGTLPPLPNDIEASFEKVEIVLLH